MNKPIPFPRHGIPGYYALADLPQRAPLSESAVSTGWQELDKILKIYPSQFIVTTGNAGSGKSTFLFNLIINLCWKNKTKAWLYVPENEMNLLQKMTLMFGDKPEGSLFGQFANTKCFVQSSNYEHYYDEPRDIEEHRAPDDAPREMVDAEPPRAAGRGDEPGPVTVIERAVAADVTEPVDLGRRLQRHDDVIIRDLIARAASP